VEVFATVLVLQFRFALRDAVEQSVAVNRNEPEHENVRTYEDHPMHQELHLLLRCDLSLGAFN
jgi:hypothetical protein